jgi:hypothetical protein
MLAELLPRKLSNEGGGGMMSLLHAKPPCLQLLLLLLLLVLVLVLVVVVVPFPPRLCRLSPFGCG